jgi:hypothetical protein
VRRVVRAGCPVAEAGVANVEAGEVGGELDDTDVGHGHGGAQEIGTVEVETDLVILGEEIR